MAGVMPMGSILRKAFTIQIVISTPRTSLFNMIYTTMELSIANAEVKKPGINLSNNLPSCCRCGERKTQKGGKRFKDKRGYNRFICEDCKNANI